MASKSSDLGAVQLVRERTHDDMRVCRKANLR